MSGERENDSLLEVQNESGDNIPTKKLHNSEYQTISHGETLKGVLVSLLLALIMAISKVCVQALNDHIPHLQLNTMRLITPSAGLILYYITSGKWPIVERKYWKPMVLFCLTSNVITLGMYVLLPFFERMSN